MRGMGKLSFKEGKHFELRAKEASKAQRELQVIVRFMFDMHMITWKG